jgi:hypothetical protein
MQSSGRQDHFQACEIPAAALLSITNVIHLRSGSQLAQGMAARAGLYFLHKIQTVDCSPGWLPARKEITCRKYQREYIHTLPDGMHALEDLQLEGCGQLARDWLTAAEHVHLERLSNFELCSGQHKALQKLNPRPAGWLTATRC